MTKSFWIKVSAKCINVNVLNDLKRTGPTAVLWAILGSELKFLWNVVHLGMFSDTTAHRCRNILLELRNIFLTVNSFPILKASFKLPAAGKKLNNFSTEARCLFLWIPCGLCQQTNNCNIKTNIRSKVSRSLLVAFITKIILYVVIKYRTLQY